MVDGFNGLRHHAVVRRNNQNRDIGRLRAAGAHRREGFVARRIQEGDLAVAHLGDVRADMLGNAAGLARGHLRLADVIQQRRFAVVNVAHDRDDRGTRDQLFLAVLHVLGREHVLGSLIELHFQRHTELGSHQRRGIEIQLLVNRRHDAQQHQFLDDLARRFADALGQIADGDGLGGHVGRFDLDRGHHLLRGELTALLAAAAHHVVIHAVARIARKLLAVLHRLILRVMLTLAHLLVRIVVGNALLLDRGHQLRALRGALRTAAHRTLSAHAACRARAALLAVARAKTALGTISARRKVAALGAIPARGKAAALGTIATRGKITALRTVSARRKIAALCARCALRTISARRKAAALCARRVAVLLRTGRRGRRSGRLRFRLLGGRLRLFLLLLGLFHRHIVGHRPCLALRAERLLLLFAALFLALGLLLLRKAVFNLAQLGERLFRRGTDSRHVSQQLRRPAAEFLCCVLNLHFGHSALAPPQICVTVVWLSSLKRCVARLFFPGQCQQLFAQRAPRNCSAHASGLADGLPQSVRRRFIKRNFIKRAGIPEFLFCIVGCVCIQNHE